MSNLALECRILPWMQCNLTIMKRVISWLSFACLYKKWSNLACGHSSIQPFYLHHNSFTDFGYHLWKQLPTFHSLAAGRLFSLLRMVYLRRRRCRLLFVFWISATIWNNGCLSVYILHIASQNHLIFFIRWYFDPHNVFLYNKSFHFWVISISSRSLLTL